MKTLFRVSIFLLTSALVTACGGGSSTSTPDMTTPTPTQTTVAPTTATVGIILTDASIDDYDHAFVTITSVKLLGDDNNQEIFSGEETVDLLALRDTLTLFAVNENVEPGDVNKIRLIASNMVLVVDHDDGTTTDTPVELVANGKIDLNPRGTFSIAAGDVVIISLDWDMRESLKLIETGSGKIKMRPVIFVEIGTAPAFKGGLVRVSGLVELIAPDFTAFRICAPDFSIQPVGTPVVAAMCLDILINDSTGIFDDQGKPVGVVDLGKGDPVTVIGLLQRSMDGPVVTPMEDDDGEVEQTPFQVVSIVVEGGPPGTWVPVKGTLQTVVDEMSGEFDYQVDEGQGFEADTVLTGLIVDATRLFSIAMETGVTEIDAADLQPEDRAVADSVQVVAADPADPDVLRIAIMLSRTPGDPIADSLSGTILSVNLTEESLMLSTSMGDRCVTTDVDTRIFQLFVHDDSTESVEVTLGDLDIGAKTGIVGMEDGMGCFAADLIISEGQASADE